VFIFHLKQLHLSLSVSLFDALNPTTWI